MKKAGTDTSGVWDVIVIGGGPAGMIAAGRAAEKARQEGRGPETADPAKVLLLEKNDGLGKKLLITGGGRCNVTNAEFDDRALLARFKDDSKFLFSAFSQYSVEESLAFFNSRGMATKVEAEKRVFPVSDSARSVWETLVAYMKAGGVTVRSDCAVGGFVQTKPGHIDAVKVGDGKSNGTSKTAGEVIRGRSFILATGGKSQPETGSTGEGFDWLRKIGHTVIEPSAALVPIEVSDAWVKQLSGISLPKAKITLFQNGIKQSDGTGNKTGNKKGARTGKVLFTHFGLSGPAILNMSAEVSELMKYGDVVMSLDLLPQHDYATLNDALQKLFSTDSNKKFKNAIGTIIPAAFIPIILERSGIEGDTPCHSVTREARLGLIKLLKDIHMHPTRLLGADKAIITSGGVALTEVDFKTMRSRLVPNLYLVGDVLNIDRPSGGYSLQLCWTTGWVAGSSAA